MWCEHGGTSDQIQGNPVAKAANTNPDHCFEIHPATEIAGVDVSATWKEIPDFKTKDAEAAFSAYELVGLENTHNDSTQRTKAAHERDRIQLRRVRDGTDRDADIPGR